LFWHYEKISRIIYKTYHAFVRLYINIYLWIKFDFLQFKILKNYFAVQVWTDTRTGTEMTNPK